MSGEIFLRYVLLQLYLKKERFTTLGKGIKSNCCANLQKSKLEGQDDWFQSMKIIFDNGKFMTIRANMKGSIYILDITY